jgi:pyridoxine/pyridoxamine 5'-phosphate oxidase
VGELTREDLLPFLRSHSLAVEASCSESHATPQAAVVGFAVTDNFEVVFDTVDTSRKAQNLRRNPNIALVIGGMTADDERTVQYEGIVDEPSGSELEKLREHYYTVFPEGRERLDWPGLIYIRARPSWMRYSDYNQDPRLVVEFEF